MKQATFRVLFFPKCNRYVAIAWNYNEAVLISTRDRETYEDAKVELMSLADERGVELRWFDGEYEVIGDDLIVPRATLT